MNFESSHEGNVFVAAVEKFLDQCASLEIMRLTRENMAQLGDAG